MGGARGGSGDGPLLGGAAPGDGVVRRAPRGLLRQRLRRPDALAPAAAAAGRARRVHRPVRGRGRTAGKGRGNRSARPGHAPRPGPRLQAHGAAPAGAARRPARLLRGARVLPGRRGALRPPAQPAGMNGAKLRYIGDISREDAALLARTAAGARRILEFGAGASTQVLAISAPQGAEIVTVETKPEWVASTRAH